MLRQILYATAIAGVLSGCTTSKTADMPTQFASGNHSWRYQSQFGNLISIADYSGEWSNNKPSGQGSLRMLNPDGSVKGACRGVFGVPAPANDTFVLASLGAVYVDGELSDGNGTVIYRGVLANYLPNSIACTPTGQGTYYWGDGWSLGGAHSYANRNYLTFFTGHCAIGAPDGRRWDGGCTVLGASETSEFGSRLYRVRGAMRTQSPDQNHDTVMLTFSELSDPFVLAHGPGQMRLVNGDVVEGVFNAGRANDGLMRLTTTSGEPWLAYWAGGELLMRHPAPATIESNGKHCGADGWLLMSGQCRDGRWHGDVEAYSADGLERIAGHFKQGQADGEVSWSRVTTAHQVVGELAAGPVLGFDKARITVAGTPRYQGAMEGFSPSGQGVCWVEGQPERCEYLHGSRIDALHKTRLENQRLAAEQERQRREQLAQQQAQQRLQQQQAQQRQAQQDGDFFGKALALGIGAAVVGSSGLDANVAAQAYSGFAADVMTDGQAGGIAAATQNIAAQQQATARAAATRPGLPLADETQSWERARSSVAGSSMQGASMANGTIAAGTAATGRAAPGGVGTPGGSLAAMAGFSQGKASADAARSDELNDNIAAVAARIGMKMREFTYQCGPQGEKTSVNVPYRSEACAAAKEYWFQVYACNDVYNMDKAIDQCRSGCGNPNCEEVE